MNRVMWYPNWTHREAVERLLEKPLELERENKITLWADEDENGKRFYDIRELPNETTPNKACTRRGAGWAIIGQVRVPHAGNANR